MRKTFKLRYTYYDNAFIANGFHMLCKDGLRKWVALPNDAKNITLTFTTKEDPDSTPLKIIDTYLGRELYVKTLAGGWVNQETYYYFMEQLESFSERAEQEIIYAYIEYDEH